MIPDFDNWSERKRKKTLAEVLDLKGHQWRKITRKGQYSHWICKACGVKARRDCHIIDLPPNPNNIEESIRHLTCDEMIVSKVMEA